MEATEVQQGNTLRKKMSGKRDDSPLHMAAREGQIGVIMEILANNEGQEDFLWEKLLKQNQAGETPLFVAAEYGYVDLVREFIKYYDLDGASVKANNGLNALHIAAKQGDLEIIKALLETHQELKMTVAPSNTTALHTAANQGHIEVVNYFLQAEGNLANISKSNGKTALHSAARNGHVEVVNALLHQYPLIATRTDKKGQTALHMAVKGLNIKVVEELIKADPSPINMVDTKGNTALHIAARKGRVQIVKLLLGLIETNLVAINRSNETALDTAEKTGQAEVASMLREHGVQRARSLKSQGSNPTRELKQTVSDIKHEVHNQLEHTRQTRKRVQGITKGLNKLHVVGLNNAINSTTIVAVFIAALAFAAIFQIPTQLVDDVDLENGCGRQPAFVIFFISDALALFISLAVVVVQTSVVVIKSKAKRKLIAIINKVMWVACVLISVAFLALVFVEVGKDQIWLAITVTIIGSVIMAATLSTMCFWVIMHRIEASNLRCIRRTSLNTSRSWSGSMVMSDKEHFSPEYKHMYAI